MPFIDFNGKQLETNDEGFLVNPDEWSKELAEVFAKNVEGIDSMTDDHWAVVNYIHDYYMEKKTAPMVRKICKSTKLKLKEIYELFPSGPANGAAKIAGLPKPDGCV